MRTAFLIVGLVVTSGCASSNPAPIAYGSQSPPPHAAPPLAEPDWAAAEGTPLSAYALRPEDVHPYDPSRPPQMHRVAANETLYDIATRYQVPLLALIGENGLEPPYAVAHGQELRLPPPRFHIARRGERFEEIAQRYSVDTRSLALLNRVTLPHEVREGERIVLPASARAGPPAPSPAAGVTTDAAGASASRDSGEAPAVHIGRFTWPLRGDVVARFGAQPGGGRLDGVEIAGREGAHVLAAGDGEVVYAGADLEAYGALVLVRHADNIVTAYGFGRRVLVREGQLVRAGQPVAELGDRPGGARLLFQVRRGRDAIDPLPLLGRP